MYYIVFSMLFFVAAVFVPNFLPNMQNLAKLGVRAGLVFLGALCIISTSFVTIGSDEVGQLFRIYLAEPLPSGRIIALSGEKGPQAEILPPGFHFRLLLNVLNTVEKLNVFEVSAGQYGKLVARDGLPLKSGQTFADAFTDEKMLDATYFLTQGGQKGPQISVLTPGKYRLNRYLWDVELDSDSDIDKGFVGVVKSNAQSKVNFGNLSFDKPSDCQPTVETDLSGGKLAVPLVPVGCIGIWDKPILPGRYYINKSVYTVMKMDTRLQKWEFKGGFKRRTIALTVDQQGKIKQEESSTDEPVKEEYADRAVFLKMEGWDIPQELRALVQITPENAPMVVASVGGEKEVEDRIVVPAVRSIVRDVTGGGFITVTEMDVNGNMIKVTRAPRVLDLLNNRDVLEAKIRNVMRIEGMKAGVEIKEIRFGDPAVPPELLVARLREQLAQQLSASYQQEKTAQDDRIKTENARATADQQEELVKAQIELLRAGQLKQAAELVGQGEELKLKAIAAGQKAQASVLGEDRVVELRKYELLVARIFDAIEKHPELLTAALANAGKLVPNTIITTGNGGGLEGPAAILGALMNKAPTTTPIVQK